MSGGRERRPVLQIQGIIGNIVSQVIWSDPSIERIVQTVSARTGLFFRDSQRETVEIGIGQAMKLANRTSLADYAQLIDSHSRAFDALMIELTVGETYFLRDLGQMSFIRENILPEIRGRREPNRSIRIWSAGCASGEEAYSLAMLAREDGLSDQMNILASDISRRSLERAQQARYGEWSLRGEGADIARKYLRREGTHYQLDPAIRSLVRFEYLNLALDVYPSAVTGTRELDLILCRNVLIYFDRETIASVARRFYDSLAPGGWVVTAAGDPSLETYAPFETVLTNFGLFYRRGPTIPTKPTNHTETPPAQVSTIPPVTWAVRFPHRVDVIPTPQPVASPMVVDSTPVVETLISAQRALETGNYQLAAEIALQLPDTVETAAIHVQALANSDLLQAERVCAAAGKRHLLSAHLQYLHAVLLLDLNREHEAVQALRRAVYLDHTLAIAHFTLGSVLRRLGDLDGARRSFRNAKSLCEARPAEEVVRFSDGEQAGTLAQASQSQLEGLNR